MIGMKNAAIKLNRDNNTIYLGEFCYDVSN